MKNLFVAAAILVALIAPAHAQRTTGADMLKWCSAPPTPDIGYSAAVRNLKGNELQIAKQKVAWLESLTLEAACNNRLRGFVDAIRLWEQYGNNEIMCIDANVDNGQLRDVFLQFVKAHPAQRHMDIDAILVVAFSEAFPCGKKKS